MLRRHGRCCLIARKRAIEPDTVPVRVIAHSRYQASADWVGNDVASNPAHLFVTAQGAVMEARLPDSLVLGALPVKRATAA